jgi:hypothetical protein
MDSFYATKLDLTPVLLPVQNAEVCGSGGRDLGGRHETHDRIAPKFNDLQSPKWAEIAFVERNFRPGFLSLAQIARA